MTKQIKVIVVLTWLIGIVATATAQVQVSVAPYYGGRLAALSMTFDDGLEDQFTLAAPQLNRRGIKATFAIIGSKVGGIMRSKQDRADGTDGTPVMTWDMIRQLHRQGHEVSSHGWQHRAVTRLSAEELRHEVQHNDTVIYEQTGQFPRSFFYPGNSKSDATVAFCEQGRVGSRTFQISLGSKRDAAWLRQWVDGLIEKGEWGVTMTHGIARGYDHFADPQVLWSFLDGIAARQDELWVAPFSDVAAYVRERNEVQLSVSQQGRQLIVTPSTTLDARLFSHPLTLMVKGVVTKAVQQGISLSVSHRQGNSFIDFHPHQGEIQITPSLVGHPSAVQLMGRWMSMAAPLRVAL